MNQQQTNVVNSSNTWIGEWSHIDGYGSRIILNEDGTVKAFPSIVYCSLWSQDQINESRESYHYAKIKATDLVFSVLNSKSFALSFNSYVYTFTCLESTLPVHLA